MPGYIPTLHVWSLLLVSLLTGALCWPMGDLLTQSVCRGDMKPKSAVGVAGMEGHLRMAQNHLPGKKPFLPYYMVHNQTSYGPNSQTVLSVVANQTESLVYYKGILLQARTVICASNNTIMVEDTPLGSWIVKSPPGKPGHLLSTMDCTGQNSKSAVRHRTPAMKIREVVTWKAPSEPVGHVVFWATIVQQGNIHWTGVHSTILLDPRGGKPPFCGAGSVRNTLLVTVSAALLGHIMSTLRLL